MCNSRCGCNRNECWNSCENNLRESRCCDNNWREGRCGCNDDFRWVERWVREIEERRRAEDCCARQFRRCLNNSRCCGNNRY